MLALSASAFALVPPPLLSPTVQRGNTALPQSRVWQAPRMGFFDDLKKGFENDAKLDKKGVDTTPGKTKNVAGYIKQKENRRKQKEAQQSNQKTGEPGEDRMAELLGKFKW
mmetsp:Transcript_14522/g.29398  ORF Transcript_14522/g.29398 Transcript_14522/m.29398 type:complete len:111 (-) Transcript_14522:368-700(-)